jgi:uncharacterized membrane protein YeaQ/YmgE (transglycosylase-associated protein family)
MTLLQNPDRLHLHQISVDDVFRIAGIRPLDPKESKDYMDQMVLRTWDLPSILGHFHGASGHDIIISRALWLTCIITGYVLGTFGCYLLGLSENLSLLSNVVIPGIVGCVAGAAYLAMVHRPLMFQIGLANWRESPVGSDGAYLNNIGWATLHPEALRLVRTIGAILPQAEFSAVCFDTDPVLRMRLYGSPTYYDLMIWDGGDIVLIHPYLS